MVISKENYLLDLRSERVNILNGTRIAPAVFRFKLANWHHQTPKFCSDHSCDFNLVGPSPFLGRRVSVVGKEIKGNQLL